MSNLSNENQMKQRIKVTSKRGYKKIPKTCDSSGIRLDLHLNQVSL
jgi:hypothetical protein